MLLGLLNNLIYLGFTINPFYEWEERSFKIFKKLAEAPKQVSGKVMI